MKIFCVVGMLYTAILSSCGYIYAAEKEASQIPTVTLSLLDVTVDEIIKEVSKQVGYTVQVEGGPKGPVVSGRYIDVPLDQFFHRIFKHKNVVLSIDTRKKMVTVNLFDSSLRKEYVKLQAKDDPDSKLALSNVRLSELEEIFAKEEQIHQGWREDPNAVMPFTSITKVGFKEIVDQEAEDEQERKLDPERKVALSDVTHSEAKLILEQEGQEAQARRQDPNTKIALSDMTQSEYKIRMELEERRYQQVKNDPNERIPFSEVTYSEFHALQTQ